ncbi:hypothetical protein HmCmsJML030_03849 [Escherichia coli]|nr:hypothetical protein [Escherichia coli]GCU65898.1 hypothetical protein HmCmsJML030_03849 [Escherichia coli]
MKPRNINNSLQLQPLVPDQENKNKKNEEKYVNQVKLTIKTGLNYIEQESLGGTYIKNEL